MFQQLSRLNSDSILGLMAKYRADSSPEKVDLGVGVYRDLCGNTPILSSVRRAEQEVLAEQTTKSYVAAAGREEFNALVENLVLGSAHAVRRDGRARTVQTPGGGGALRVGAELVRAAVPNVTVHMSDPTWGNHAPLLGSSGLRLERYPYYDIAAHELRFDAMLEHIDRAAAGDLILVHACCHNPTGADLKPEQWSALAQLLKRRNLVPFLDLAYQGFGADLDADAAGVRTVLDAVPESLIAVSLSKNLGLYRERVGALILVGENPSRTEAMLSHVLQIARSIYSMPPDHGAAIAARIFASAPLKAQWMGELAAMRSRIVEMRSLLARELRRAIGEGSYDFIESQHGMFSLLGVSADAVTALRDQHHVYMTADSRMNLAGVMPQNVRYLADAIAAVAATEARC